MSVERSLLLVPVGSECRRTPMSALTRSGETACVGPRALPEWRSVRGRRAPCLIAGRKTANLEELQAQRLDPVQQSVKGRLILDRPVKHCLHGLGRHREPIERSEDPVAAAPGDPDLI